MKKIVAVRITNATTTGQVLITLVLADTVGNKTKLNMPAIIGKDTWTCAITYHADTIERDEELQKFLSAATKTEKVDGDKFSYIYQ